MQTAKKIKNILSYFMVYISIVGLIGFTLFIIEEANQVACFGTFPAKSSSNWELVIEGTDIMDGASSLLKIINNTIGWLNPLGFLSYRSYAKSSDFYTKSLRTQAFANAPELFVGKKVEFYFTPKSIEHKNNQIHLMNRNITIIVNEEPTSTKKIKVVGTLEQIDGHLQVNMTKN